MTQRKSNSNGLDRRQFFRGAVASTAAAGMIPIGQACAITRDASGKLLDWVCRIDVVEILPRYWMYRYKNCRTGQTWIGADVPELPLGNCGSPQGGGCVLQDEWDRYETITDNEFELVLLPGLDNRIRSVVRAEFGTIKERLA